MADEFSQAQILFAITHRPGPNFRPELPPTKQVGVAEHFAYVQALEASGAILLSGPMLAPGSGGLMVLSHGIGAPEAARIAEDDPATKSGLVIAEVVPWMITAGDAAAVPGPPETSSSAVPSRKPGDQPKSTA